MSCLNRSDEFVFTLLSNGYDWSKLTNIDVCDRLKPHNMHVVYGFCMTTLPILLPELYGNSWQEVWKIDYPGGRSSLKIQLLLLGSVNVSYSQLVCTAVGLTWLLLILVYGQDCPFINVKKYLKPSQCTKKIRPAVVTMCLCCG